jgi:signal peptidase II
MAGKRVPRLSSVWKWFALAGLVVILDQVSKHTVQARLVYGESVRVTGFLDLVLVYNPGAAFSFLSDASGWQRELFAGIAIAAAAFITYLLVRHRDKPLFCLALACILGGAIGNLVDRLMLGAVVDFLHFHVAQYYWPAFNLADSAITCGAAVLIWESFFGRSAPARGQSEQGTR